MTLLRGRGCREQRRGEDDDERARAPRAGAASSWRAWASLLGLGQCWSWPEAGRGQAAAAGERGAGLEHDEPVAGVEGVGSARHRLDGHPAATAFRVGTSSAVYTCTKRKLASIQTVSRRSPPALSSRTRATPAGLRSRSPKHVSRRRASMRRARRKSRSVPSTGDGRPRRQQALVERDARARRHLEHEVVDRRGAGREVRVQAGAERRRAVADVGRVERHHEAARR